MSLITRIFRVIRLSTRRRPAENTVDGAPTTLTPGELVYGEAENKFYICKNDSTIIEWNSGVLSDPRLVPNSLPITNMVRISQANYDALVSAGQTDATTLYVIE
jgi:hypothetical protein